VRVGEQRTDLGIGQQPVVEQVGEVRDGGRSAKPVEQIHRRAP
jgi:hypothetical protein